MLLDTLFTHYNLAPHVTGPMSLAIGCVGEFAYYSLQDILVKYADPQNPVLRWICVHVFTYVISVLSVFHWLGTWYSCDALLGECGMG